MSNSNSALLSMRIAIIGSGAFATALAKILVDSGQQNVCIYGVSTGELADLARGQNLKYFKPEWTLPRFAVTNDLSKALAGARVVVLAVPSKVMAAVFASVLAAMDTPALIISGSKGFFPGTRLSIHEGLANHARGSKLVRGVVSLVGPSFAEEMVQEKFTAVAAVSAKVTLAKEVQRLFTNEYFRVYTQTDVKGAMACAIFKNVLALASGMTSELIGAHNSAAALLTRGLREMSVFVSLQGGQKMTVLGLAGVGDLMLTATSHLSRNYSAGAQIARSGLASLDPSITVEGINGLSTVYQIAHDAKADLPIVNFLYEVIVTQTKTAQDFKSALWKRPLIAET